MTASWRLSGSTILREFDHAPNLAGLGGRVELYDTNDLPYTIRRSRVREDMDEPHKVFHLITGCNIAFARWAIEQVGGFDERFGPGAPLVAAEEIDYLYRMHRGGLKVIYTPDVVVYHNHGRRTAEAVDVLMRSYMIGRGALYAKYVARGDFTMLRLAYSAVGGSCAKRPRWLQLDRASASCAQPIV